MKVVSFTIFKGGTGKTTSSVNTAVALVRRGKRVLLVDLDQQASATRYLGIDPESSPSLYQVFMGSRSAASCIRPTGVGVDMLTANTYLAAIEEALEPGDEMKLAGLLTPLKVDYDFILLDSPPGKARLTFSGLAASDLVVITCAAERMALDGVADMIGHIQRHMWGKYPELEHQELRILFTMYRNTTTHAPAVVASAQKIWRDNIFGVRIPPPPSSPNPTTRSSPSWISRRAIPAPWPTMPWPAYLSRMKTPRLDDYAQTPTRPIRELHSPLDDMPRIEKPPRTHHRPDTPPRHDEAVALPGQAVSLPPAKTRTAEPAKRSFVRRSFDFYEDQVSYLTRVSLEERMAGREGSMNAMVREALDDYIQKKKAIRK